MNILKKLVFTSLLSLSSFSFSEVSLSGNVALTTDYVWRGMTQNGGDPSISGGFDLEDDSGFYLGVWAANVAASDGTDTGSIELDGYLGYSGSFNDDSGYDVGFIAYTYPAVDSWDFEELYISFDFSNRELQHFGNCAGRNPRVRIIVVFWASFNDLFLSGYFPVGRIFFLLFSISLALSLSTSLLAARRASGRLLGPSP